MKPGAVNNIGFIAIIAMLCLAGALSIGLFYREKTSPDTFNMAEFPRRVGEWSSRDLPVTEREYGMLGTRNLIVREYSNAAQEKIYLFIIYSETNRSVFHSPEACLIGEGITIVGRSTERVGSDKYAFLANRLNLEKDKSKEIVLYCYKAGDIYTDNYYLQQAHLALRQIFGRRASGATIRASMASGRDEARALRELKDFIKATVDILDKVPS